MLQRCSSATHRLLSNNSSPLCALCGAVGSCAPRRSSCGQMQPMRASMPRGLHAAPMDPASMRGPGGSACSLGWKGVVCALSCCSVVSKVLGNPAGDCGRLPTATLLGIGLSGGTDLNARGVGGDRPALSPARPGCGCVCPGRGVWWSGCLAVFCVRACLSVSQSNVQNAQHRASPKKTHLTRVGPWPRGPTITHTRVHNPSKEFFFLAIESPQFFCDE